MGFTVFLSSYTAAFPPMDRLPCLRKPRVQTEQTTRHDGEKYTPP